MLIPESQNGYLFSNDSLKAARRLNSPVSDINGYSDELLNSIHRTTSLGELVAAGCRNLQPGLGDIDDNLAEPSI